MHEAIDDEPTCTDPYPRLPLPSESPKRFKGLPLPGRLSKSPCAMASWIFSSTLSPVVVVPSK